MVYPTGTKNYLINQIYIKLNAKKVKVRNKNDDGGPRWPSGLTCYDRSARLISTGRTVGQIPLEDRQENGSVERMSSTFSTFLFEYLGSVWRIVLMWI
jgi:hypothetical protein